MVVSVAGNVLQEFDATGNPLVVVAAVLLLDGVVVVNEKGLDVLEGFLHIFPINDAIYFICLKLFFVECAHVFNLP